MHRCAGIVSRSRPDRSFVTPVPALPGPSASPVMSEFLDAMKPYESKAAGYYVRAKGTRPDALPAVPDVVCDLRLIYVSSPYARKWNGYRMRRIIPAYAVSFRSSCSVQPYGFMPVTLKTPFVSVPVLSKTTVSGLIQRIEVVRRLLTSMPLAEDLSDAS